ncbi:MAG: caspase family protein [Nitrospirae bacterium]|nr:caspase family protein [Nitrospirota bacterium]
MKLSILFSFLFLFSGCETPLTVPERLDPLSGLDIVRPAYKDMTVGIVISENTKRTVQFLHDARGYGSFDYEKINTLFTDFFRRNFKKAVRLEKIEDANMAQLDMIVIADLYVNVDIHNVTELMPEKVHAQIDAALIILSLDHKQIDTIKGLGIGALERPGYNPEKLILEALDNLGVRLRSSMKLAEFLKARVRDMSAYTPQSKNTSGFEIDIHKIPDFKSEPRPNDLAVIIGIEAYKGLPSSDYSKNDALIIKDYLKALGFQEKNIALITDQDATKSGIEKSIEAWLPNKIKNDSRVIVYFSGHGAPEPNKGGAYIVPYDGDPNYLETTGYSLKRLYERLGMLESQEIIVLIDSCFSGLGGRSVFAKGARPLVMLSDIKDMPRNMAVLSATQGTQISTSAPDKGHGIFTYYFLKALKDGKKTIAEIYEQIKPLVENEAKALNVKQSPSISPDADKLKGRFSLRK